MFNNILYIDVVICKKTAIIYIPTFVRVNKSYCTAVEPYDYK